MNEWMCDAFGFYGLGWCFARTSCILRRPKIFHIVIFKVMIKNFQMSLCLVVPKENSGVDDEGPH